VRVSGGRLLVAGRDAETLAREHGTPLYVFDLERVAEQARALQQALARAGLRPRVRLALKALHETQVLEYVRSLGAPGEPGAVGLDACSPGEVERALACGFEPGEISYTGTNVSGRDLDILAPLAVHLNLDLLSQIERVGRRCPGRTVGLRLNPRAGVMRGQAESLYSGARPTKFGIYEEDLDRALALAARHRLTIDTAHVHIANGMLDEELPAFDLALEKVAGLVRGLLARGCPLTEVNVGGGLGTPLHEGERPLDLDAYASIVARQLGDLGLTVAVEPGEFLANEAAALLAQVVTVEERMGTTFVGLDVGWNVMNDRYIYGHDLELVVAAHADAPRERRATVTGHINEGDDVFVADAAWPEVAEGDIVAFVGAGGYSPGMWTDHCLRPRAAMLFFDHRLDARGVGTTCDDPLHPSIDESGGTT